MTAGDHRVNEDNLEVYVSQYNQAGYWAEPVGYKLTVEDDRLVIVFDDVQFGRYIKIHSHFCEMDADGAVQGGAASFALADDDPFEVGIVSAGRNEFYSYDAKGNRVMASILARGEFSVRDYTYYAGSDLVKTDGREGFVYDDNGRLIERGDEFGFAGSEVELDVAGSYQRYEYDLRGRLVAVYGIDEDEAGSGEAGGSGSAGELVLLSSYTYNDRGYRIQSASADGKIINYTFDSHPTEGKVLEESVSGGGGASGVTSYVYFGSLHLARIRDGVTEYYGTDHLGSTVLLTDDRGREVWSGSVTPFADQESSGEGESVKFTGKDLDAATGLYYFNARWYDAGTGRFISQDPMRDGANWYVYVGNNPLGFVDPSGMIGQNIGADADYASNNNGRLPDGSSDGSGSGDGYNWGDQQNYSWENHFFQLYKSGKDFDEVFIAIKNHHSNPFEYISDDTAKRILAETSLGDGPFYINPNPGSQITSFFDSERPIIVTPNGIAPSGHFAIDSAGGYGRIIAANEGLVIDVGNRRQIGNFVDIQHPSGEVTRYAHLEQAVVLAGDWVKVGQNIGIEGNTGVSTGSHLHFEIKPYNGASRQENINPINRIIN